MPAGYAAGLKSEASTAKPILSAAVGTHSAHSPSPHVGYPHAGQIANDLPSRKVLIATAVLPPGGRYIAAGSEFKPTCRSGPHLRLSTYAFARAGEAYHRLSSVLGDLAVDMQAQSGTADTLRTIVDAAAHIVSGGRVSR